MARIAFFCIPAHGHTNPTLAVVQELVQRGHTVRYYSYEAFREKITSAGAEFIPCDDYDFEGRLSAKQAAKIGKDIGLSTRILVDTTLALDEMVCADMKAWQPDCIVADSMAVWGKLTAQKLGIPFVSSTTTFAFNQHSAKIMKQSISQLIGMLFAMPAVQRDLKRLQGKGYQVNNILDIIQNDENTHTIVYTSPQFQPCADTFSDKYAFVGPSIRPIGTPVVKTRDTLIYVSMGTVNNDMAGFYRRCIQALSGKGYQIILSVGRQVNISALGTLPDGVEVYAHIDQIGVLSQTDVFVTHCGMNSVNEALWFGVPLVMLPQTTEQGGVANRVLELGAGVQLEKIAHAAIRSAVETVLFQPQYRRQAREIARGFHECTGAKGATDKILQVCRE